MTPDFVFDKPGRFWKGNIHTHSTQSDGCLTPAEVCRVYQGAGYHFLALTDHFSANYQFPITDTRPYQICEFITLLGAELHAGQIEWGETWHMLGVGLPSDFAHTPNDETGPDLAARALASGAFVVAAHPGWYTLTEVDIISLGDIHAIETFNGTAIDDNDRYDAWYLFDMLTARGRHYYACATDDAYFDPKRHDALRGWLWVKSEELSSEAILQALKSGHYYSSTGPQIYDIDVEPGNKISIHCSPASSVFIVGRGAAFECAHGNNLIQAELSLKNFHSPYCRVTVRDARGGRAWSNPIWF